MHPRLDHSGRIGPEQLPYIFHATRSASHETPSRRRALLDTAPLQPSRSLLNVLLLRCTQLTLFSLFLYSYSSSLALVATPEFGPALSTELHDHLRPSETNIFPRRWHLVTSLLLPWNIGYINPCALYVELLFTPAHARALCPALRWTSLILHGTCLSFAVNYMWYLYEMTPNPTSVCLIGRSKD